MRILDIKRGVNIEQFEAYNSEFKSFCVAGLATLTPKKERIDFFKNSLYESLNGKGFSIPSPFYSASIDGYNSFRFRGGRNVIVLGKDDETVLVVQKYYYIDQIYILEKNEIVLLGDTFENTLNLFTELKNEYLRLKTGGKFSEQKHKAILNVETNRPFHAMYPILGALSFINKHINIGMPIQCFTGKSSFYDYSSIFTWIVELTSKEHNFMVRAEDWMFSNDLNSDQLIYNDSINNHHLPSEFDGIKLCNKYILWIDLNSEKRKLKSRNELIYQLLDGSSIRLDENNVIVIFDGLTRQGTKGDRVPFKIDLESLEELKIDKYLTTGFEFYHASGLTICQKIKLASNIDFFVSDAGTASMIPDRFCNKSGIVYKPKGWAAPGHVYFNSTMVPEDKVTNCNENNAVNSDYNICPKYLSNFILDKMLASRNVQ
jgi:hypothetical protein